MEIEFTLTAEDLAVFALYHQAQQIPRGWRRFFTLFWGVVAFFGLSFIVQVGKLLTGIDAWENLAFASAIVGGLLILRLVWWWWQPIAIRRSLRKQLAAADPKARSYYEQRLRLTPEGIVLATPLSTQLTDWAAVERIDMAESHGFIYISPTEAYVIPGRVFQNEGEFHALIDQARSFRERAARA
jgi:hypothetical protein